METIGLNNLEQYFTIIYTMSFPSHMLYCIFIIVQNPKPHPLCYREFCWFPFKLWLVSQMYKKLRWLVGWLVVFLKSRVCKNGSDLPSDFVLSKTPL